MLKKPLHILIAVIVLFAVVWALGQWKPGAEEDTRKLAFVCTAHGSTISFHIHPVLTIVVNGEQIVIPANVGVTPDCMRTIHTHTGDGVIHIEAPEAHDFTLGDFFAVWNQPFSATQILGNVADDTHKVTMTINGEVVDTYENTILRDKDQIVITYGE
jgi:hypothetical protein